MIKPCTYVRKKTAKGAKVKCRLPNHFWPQLCFPLLLEEGKFESPQIDP